MERLDNCKFFVEKMLKMTHFPQPFLCIASGQGFFTMQRVAWVRAFSILFTFLIFLPPSAVADDTDTRLSLDEIARCIRDRQSRLHRILVDSYLTSVTDAWSRTDRIYFASSDHYAFLEYVHNATVNKDDWLDNGWFRLCRDKSELTIFKPFERVLSPADSEGIKVYWSHLYLKAIGWHSDVQLFGEQGTGVFANDFVTTTQRDDYVLVDSTATEAGLSCIHVATRSGTEEVWLAPDMKYAIVKRVVVVRNEQNRIERTFSMSDFVQIATDIWLPRVVNLEVDRSTCDGPNEQIIRTDLKVARLAVNDQFSLEVFETKIPPGTLSVKPGSEPVLLASGGRDLMDVWGAWCATVLPATKPKPVFNWLLYLTLMNAMLLTVGVLRVLTVRRTRTDHLLAGP